MSVKHGRTLDEARARLETAVNEARSRFGPMVHRVEWSDDRNTVTLSGGGFRVEMRVDLHEVHVTGDVPALGALFAKPLENGLKQLVHQTFGKG